MPSNCKIILVNNISQRFLKKRRGVMNSYIGNFSLGFHIPKYEYLESGTNLDSNYGCKTKK